MDTIDSSFDTQNSWVQHAQKVRKTRWLTLAENILSSALHIPKEDEWKVNILYNLYRRLEYEYDMAGQVAAIENSYMVFQLAWHVRNLMELAILCQFITEDVQNLKELYEDVDNDQLDLLIKHQEWGTKAGADDDWLASINNGQQKILERATAIRSTMPTGKYREVRHMAELLGNSSEYKISNKTLSKFIHPTAFSLLTSESSILVFRDAFYGEGCMHFFHAYEELEWAAANYLSIQANDRKTL